MTRRHKSDLRKNDKTLNIWTVAMRPKHNDDGDSYLGQKLEKILHNCVIV
jgi:hypothetical protein